MLDTFLNQGLRVNQGLLICLFLNHTHPLFCEVYIILYTLPDFAAVTYWFPGDSSVTENSFSWLIVFLPMLTLVLLLGDPNIPVCELLIPILKFTFLNSVSFAFISSNHHSDHSLDPDINRNSSISELLSSRKPLNNRGLFSSTYLAPNSPPLHISLESPDQAIFLLDLISPLDLTNFTSIFMFITIS